MVSINHILKITKRKLKRAQKFKGTYYRKGLNETQKYNRAGALFYLICGSLYYPKERMLESKIISLNNKLYSWRKFTQDSFQSQQTL